MERIEGNSRRSFGSAGSVPSERTSQTPLSLGDFLCSRSIQTMRLPQIDGKTREHSANLGVQGRQRFQYKCVRRLRF